MPKGGRFFVVFDLYKTHLETPVRRPPPRTQSSFRCALPDSTSSFSRPHGPSAPECIPEGFSAARTARCFLRCSEERGLASMVFRGKQNLDESDTAPSSPLISHHRNWEYGDEGQAGSRSCPARRVGYPRSHGVPRTAPAKLPINPNDGNPLK